MDRDRLHRLASHQRRKDQTSEPGPNDGRSKYESPAQAHGLSQTKPLEARWLAVIHEPNTSTSERPSPSPKATGLDPYDNARDPVINTIARHFKAKSSPITADQFVWDQTLPDHSEARRGR